jgi:hypothetical protein
VFGLAMGAFFYLIQGDVRFALKGGLLGGLLFGLALKGFLKASLDSSALEMEGRSAGFDDGETLVHFGLANHFKGMEAVGGKLFLTNRRLRFRSHKLNIQTHDESYPIEAIASVEPSNALGIVPNAILVHLHDGRREKFVVNARGQWIDKLGQAIGTQSAG